MTRIRLRNPIRKKICTRAHSTHAAITINTTGCLVASFGGPLLRPWRWSRRASLDHCPQHAIHQRVLLLPTPFLTGPDGWPSLCRFVWGGTYQPGQVTLTLSHDIGPARI